MPRLLLRGLSACPWCGLLLLCLSLVPGTGARLGSSPMSAARRRCRVSSSLLCTGRNGSREPNEELGSYLARCRHSAQAAADFGLARGAKQLGVRRVATEESPALSDVVGGPVECRATGASRMCLRFSRSATLSSLKLRRGCRGEGSFRATMPASTDFLSIAVGEDVIELVRVGPDTRRQRDRSLPLEVKQVFSSGRKKQHTKRVQAMPVGVEDVRGDADEPSAPEGEMKIDGGTDRPRLDDSKCLPSEYISSAPKGHKTASEDKGSGPNVPGGLRLVDNASGATVFF